MTADESFGLASQGRRPRNGSLGKSARLAGGSRCRITSFVIATVSTARHLRVVCARWAFATDRQRRDPPWQNGYAERLIGSIRRECLDHVIVLGERHLRHVLGAYQQYYNGTRTHLALAKDSPLTGLSRRSAAFCRCRSSAACTIITSESDFRQGQAKISSGLELRGNAR